MKQRRIIESHADLAVRCIHKVGLRDECAECKKALLSVDA